MKSARCQDLLRSIAVALVLATLTSSMGRAADGQPSLAFQNPDPADAILGDWKPADMDVAIRIFQAKGEYVGGVVKAANPALINTEMLRGITYDPSSRIWRGEVFALKRGEFVPMTVKMTPAGFEMVAGAGLMSKTIEWVRVPVQQPGADSATR